MALIYVYICIFVYLYGYLGLLRYSLFFLTVYVSHIISL